MTRTPLSTRLVALFAAVGATTLLAASQLGLAGHYAGQTDAQLAQQASPAAVALVAASRRPA
jgi:hypothetical protein